MTRDAAAAAVQKLSAEDAATVLPAIKPGYARAALNGLSPEQVWRQRPVSQRNRVDELAPQAGHTLSVMSSDEIATSLSAMTADEIAGMIKAMTLEQARAPPPPPVGCARPSCRRPRARARRLRPRAHYMRLPTRWPALRARAVCDAHAPPCPWH
jgi:hypothetical protein